MDLDKQGKNQIKQYITNLNNGLVNKSIIKKPVRKVNRHLHIFDLINKNSNINFYYKRVGVKKFKQFFGINKDNRIIGFTPDYIGNRPSKIVTNDNIFTKFIINSNLLYDKSDKYPKTFIKQLTQSCSETRIVYSGGYDSCADHLKSFLKDNTTKISSKEIVNTIKETRTNWFYSPEIDFDDTRELEYYVRINPEAYTGHYSSKLFKLNKKLLMPITREVSLKIYDYISRYPHKNFYLWDVLGREKDIKLNLTNTNNSASTRAILCTEDAPTTLLMWFAQKIQLSLSLNKNENKFNITSEFDISKNIKLQEKENDFDFYVDADWSMFDSNVDTEFIKAATSMLLSNIKDDKKHKRIIYYIMSSIITKYVALPPGVVVELNRGVPSGHPFTTLVNCYVNLVYWTLIGIKIYGKLYYMYMDIEVYGDDAKVFFKKHDNLKNIDHYIKELGLKSDPIFPKITQTNNCFLDEDQTPDFLKRRFIDLNVKWNYKKLFDKLIYQSKSRNLNDQIELIISFYNQTPTDDILLLLLTDFYIYLLTNYKEKVINNNAFIQLETIISGLYSREEKYIYSYVFNKNYYLNNGTYDIITNSIKVNDNYIYKNLIDITNSKMVKLVYSLGFPITLIDKNKFIRQELNSFVDDTRDYFNKFYENKDKFISDIINDMKGQKEEQIMIIEPYYTFEEFMSKFVYIPKKGFGNKLYKIFEIDP